MEGIDLDLTNMRILPSNHIALKNYEHAVAVDNENKQLKSILYGILFTGIVALIIYKIKDENDRQKSIN
jgi:hypothetical protein